MVTVGIGPLCINKSLGRLKVGFQDSGLCNGKKTQISDSRGAFGSKYQMCRLELARKRGDLCGHLTVSLRQVRLQVWLIRLLSAASWALFSLGFGPVCWSTRLVPSAHRAATSSNSLTLSHFCPGAGREADARQADNASFPGTAKIPLFQCYWLQWALHPSLCASH